jgi:hypothetical protein
LILILILIQVLGVFTFAVVLDLHDVFIITVACTTEILATLPTCYRYVGAELVTNLSVPNSVTIKSGTSAILVKVAKIFVGVSEHNVICFSLCP